MAWDSWSSSPVLKFLKHHVGVSICLLSCLVALNTLIFNMSLIEFTLVGSGVVVSCLCQVSSYRLWSTRLLRQDVRLWLGRFYSAQAVKFMLTSVLFGLYFLMFAPGQSTGVLFGFMAVFSISYVLTGFMLGLECLKSKSTNPMVIV